MKYKLTRFALRTLRTARPLLPQWFINYAWHLPLAFVASYLNGNPSRDLEVIGVTGTDGKTTTTLLIYHIFKVAKKKVAVVSTVGARIGNKLLDTGFHVTSPEPFLLQKFLKKLRAQKVRYLVLEATSHGLDQFRLYPVRAKTAVLTNITHEHLDYHKTFSAYQAAKLKLFKHAENAVMNKDLPEFVELNRALPRVHLSTYSINTSSQLTPTNVRYLRGRIKFTVGSLEYELPLPGKYNLYNALAAMSVALIEGIAPVDIKRAFASFPGVPGRFEVIENDLGFRTVVDFAHTPGALKALLTSTRAQMSKDHNLIVVFGAAGLRDASKRPLMGRTASELADSVVLTAEDPRGEDVESICQQILWGSSKQQKSKFKIIENRTKAIEYALKKAKRGDWVLVCGKGHERSMNFDGWAEVPWSDQEVVKKILGVMSNG